MTRLSTKASITIAVPNSHAADGCSQPLGSMWSPSPDAGARKSGILSIAAHTTIGRAFRRGFRALPMIGSTPFLLAVAAFSAVYFGLQAARWAL